MIKNEKRHPMETSGMCLQASVSVPNLNNSFKKQLTSERKFETKMEKQQI